MRNSELFSISDLLLVLIKRKALFALVWLVVLGLVGVYLLKADRVYELTGTLYVGRFQERLIEEGEFVAHKLEDYSFIQRAIMRAELDLELPIKKLQRLVDAKVLNEIRKLEDVGLVQLTVAYPDRELTYAVFRALTDLLIEEHAEALKIPRKYFDELEENFLKEQEILKDSIQVSERFAQATNRKPELQQEVPSHLLINHSLHDKRVFHKLLLQDIRHIRLERDSITKSYNTRLAAEPVVPDLPAKPKVMLILVLGAIIATILATLSALLVDLYEGTIKPELKNA